MSDASGRYVISFNGEIYNYRELKLALEREFGAIDWRSSTDTEVLLEGVARCGLSFLDRLNGIFAIALYDSVERELHVLRDPLGVKPLFWCEHAGAVLFASEIAALRGIEGVTLTPRPGAFAEQLAFMYVPEPGTAFQEVRKVEPGVLWSFRAGKKAGERRLFRWLDDAVVRGNERDLVGEFRRLFEAAVRRQLEADVPVSLMLSGGLDSSAIAAVAAIAGARIDSAYTIAVSDGDSAYDGQGSDVKAARFVAAEFGLRLHVVQAEERMLDLLPVAVAQLEEGICDPAAINGYVISRAASRRGVKVLLSGQGADELLCGYRRTYAETLLRKLPDRPRRAVGALAHCIPARMPGAFNAVSRRARRLASLAQLDGVDRLRAMYTWAPSERIAGLFVSPPEQGWVREFEERVSALAVRRDVCGLMAGLDDEYDLRALNLAYCDRTSMAVGVEARVPFLDFDLVRFARALPSEMKLRGQTGKYILRRAMKGVLPDSVINRPKAGFGLPVRAWFRGESALVSRLCDEQRLRRQGLFRPAAVARLLEEQSEGREDWANLIYAFLSIQVWLDLNLGG
jgi:asparagine synthase (glutamine-hydrolysing)